MENHRHGAGSQRIHANKCTYFQHILREGNQIADFLANKALNAGNATLIDFRSTKAKARKIVNSNKLQSPYLRV